MFWVANSEVAVALGFALALISFNFAVANDVSSDIINGISVEKCQDLQPPPENALVISYEPLSGRTDDKRAIFSCRPGSYLEGQAIMDCTNDEWEHVTLPHCLQYCPQPPFIRNGGLEIEGWGFDGQGYPNGTVVHYSCSADFHLEPPESKERICLNGVWSNRPATCRQSRLGSCAMTEADLVNGYYIQDKSSHHRLHYGCHAGFTLVGPAVRECGEDGEWSPPMPARCVSRTEGGSGEAQSEDDAANEASRGCPPPPATQGAVVERLRGLVTANSAAPGAEMELRCAEGLRDAETPCETSKLRCVGGLWRGRTPICVEVSGCLALPGIPHGALFGLAADGHYRVGARVAYTCQPGFRLHGQPVFSCEAGGCWAPAMLPECLPDDQPFYLSGLARGWEEYALSPGAALLASLGTALAVMALLLAVCLAVVCRRRRRSGGRHAGPGSGTRAHRLHWPDESPEQPTQPTPSLLPPDPDRVALIAFADGLQIGQSVLPSYEEAVRERTAGGVLYGALHRTGRGGPHWTALASGGGGGRRGRRERHQQQDGDTVSHHSLHGGLCTRQSSSTSHSASLRSYAVGGGGDSMGSTDTVAAGSDGSTTVTLDTVSSHASSMTSGGPGSACSSQTASCRAICGSLASFDTSSVLNTEGVPLLEESELEGAAEARADEEENCGAPPQSSVMAGAETKRGASPDRA